MQCIHRGVGSMSPSTLALCLTGAFLLTLAQAKSSEEPTLRVQWAHISGNVTLHCFVQDNMKVVIHWYKQTLRQKPKRVSTLSMHTSKATLQNDFENNPRVTVDTNNTLTISDVQISDSATYYCVTTNFKEFTFMDGIIVQVNDSGLSVPASVHQSESVQPGGSLTLNCTVHTSICDGEHSVYWFRESEESRPGIIHTDGSGSDQCVRNATTQTHTCVYSLSLDGLAASERGTYYCAVATCGHVVFGNGTKLDFPREDMFYRHPAVVALMVFNCFFGMATLLLLLALYKSRRKDAHAVSRSSDEYTIVYQTTSAAPPMPSPRPRSNPVLLPHSSNSVVYSHIWH